MKTNFFDARGGLLPSNWVKMICLVKKKKAAPNSYQMLSLSLNLKVKKEKKKTENGKWIIK